MSSSQESASTMLMSIEGTSVTSKDVKDALEKGDVTAKTSMLKQMIILQLNGESQGQFIMTVIKHCVPVDDHTIKKLLLYFWEVVDKTDQTGRLLPEMILLCSFLRGDLQHPNEYIRGMTLRFLCKLKERDIFEPLVSSVIGNLTHRVSYVRRNAVLCVQNIYLKCPNLIPDAPEMIEKFIADENDVSSRRNAFAMLVQCSQERAVRFLHAFREANDMSESGDVFQLAVVDFIRNVITTNPFERSRYVPMIFAVMQSKSPAVLYQCASTLIKLSASPTAIRHAAQTFVHLLTTSSDNNIRTIVVDRLVEMKNQSPEILQDMLMEVLRGLATGSIDIRRHILNLSLDLISSKNIEPFVQFMKKELVKSQTDAVGDVDAQQEYRQLVVKAIHSSVIKHTAVAAAVVPIMLDYVCEPGASSYDVIIFVREVMQSQPHLRDDLLHRMAGVFQLITSPKVLRTVLWLFGVHCKTPDHITNIFEQLKQSLNPLPLNVIGKGKKSDNEPSSVATTSVREDGTYVTTITYVDKRHETERCDLAGLRSQLVGGDYFLAATLANTLSKLVVQLFKSNVSNSVKNTIQRDAIYIMHELINYGSSGTTLQVIDDDAHERIRLAVTVAQNPNNDFLISMVEDSFDAYGNVHSSSKISKNKDGADVAHLSRCDQPLVFTQLSKGKNSVYEFEATADDVAVAVTNDSLDKGNNFMGKLQRVTQLSGFSDPVYVEATITVHQFDILIEWLIVNQTKDTLQNLTIELAVAGEMKICERPQSYTMPPLASQTMRTSLKVSSTETGKIFGSVIFDAPGNERNCILLTEIFVDIIDYVIPSTCSITDFRAMWTAFEWENQITVNTELTGLQDYVDRIEEETNMSPLDDTVIGECNYLSSSLYAKSVFGEDALANVSLELTEGGRIEGVVRIRAKTQAIALALGEKVRAKQKRTLDQVKGK